MTDYSVDSIFIRKITPGDFWNIERAPGTGPTGGGGQTYIDIPLGGSLPKEELWSFLDLPGGHRTWPPKTIRVNTIGNSSQVADLEFGPRQGNSRYKISNQARQKPGNNRHPAWTSDNGFPQAPDDARSSSDPRIPDVSNLKVFIVKTGDGEYYAGFANHPNMPADWPQGFGLERLFDPGLSDAILKFGGTRVQEVPPLVRRIFEAWLSKPNVLLYGPTGTGKTFAMQYIWEILAGKNLPKQLDLRPENKDKPFEGGITEEDLPFELPVRREWVTFHQNYSYENFIVALRPDSSTSTLKLKPRLGVLLDAAVSTDRNVEQASDVKYRTALVCIDEVNRGNVSRIFGEFITFMESDYRAGSDQALPVPLPSVGVTGEKTEPIERPTGDEVDLPAPWYFPPNVYTLAAMNSVDRAVAPLDTALARRFARIEVPPDMPWLAEWLGIDDPEALLERSFGTLNGAEHSEVEEGSEEGRSEEQAAGSSTVSAELWDVSSPDPNAPTAGEAAYLLLYRINYELASLLGTDFELGHTYLMEVGEEESEEDRFRALAQAWDQAIYPQLRERFANRPEELSRLLRLDSGSPTPPDQYLFRKRPRSAAWVDKVGVPGARDVLDVPSLEEESRENMERVAFTLRYLVGYKVGVS